MTPLYSFTGSTGNQPSAGLIEDASGNFYGTALEGGNLSDCGSVGCGVVFELVNSSGTYTEKVLYSFTGATDGGQPLAGLIMDKAGNLYGTTQIGGTTCTDGCGVVFELTPPTAPGGSWSETVLYSFTGNNDGVAPVAGLIMDTSGNLYGTTSEGGVSPYHYGTVFELVNSSGTYTEKVLYSFTDANGDGEAPDAGLIMDTSGNLYGTTAFGGGSTTCTIGCGTVFQLTPPTAPATTWSETPLYSFTGGSDGAQPQAGLVMDTSGNLYGTTAVGGDTSVCVGAQGPGSSGCGVVFKVTSSSKTETPLYAFTYSGGAGDGALPFAGLIMDTSGNLYGTTSGGGTFDSGTVFELVNSSGTYTEKILYSFTGGSDGAEPIAGLIADTSGNFFGTAKFGGADIDGTAFAIAPVTLSASQLNFGTVETGTASAPQAVTITNIGGGTFTYTAVVSGTNAADFAIVHGCSDVAAGGMCSESLIFTPSTTTTETALLNLTEGGLTQTVSLSGTGTATAFTITPKPSSATAKPGALAKFTLTLKSQNGFTGPVTLNCSGGPAGCANFPETVEINGTTRVSSGILVPQNTARGTTFTITFTGKSGAIDEAATATVTAK